MHNLSWQKVIKRGDFFCRVPKGSAWKTPDIDLLVESARVAFYSFCDGWIDKKHRRTRVCHAKIDVEDMPVIPFGGRVFVVNCDESQFKHKSKVSKQTANFFTSQCTSVDIRTF